MSRHLIRSALLAAMLTSPLLHAEDALKLDTLTITGNRELPRVTYFLPWQPAPAPGLAEPPLDRLIDDALTPVDRDTFRRTLRYYRARAAASSAQAEKDLR